MLESRDEQNESICINCVKIQNFLRGGGVKFTLKMELFVFMPTWLVFNSLLKMVHISNED